MPAHHTDESTHHRNWSWDPSLYAGSAAHYATGRMAYPPELAAVLVTELGLDGTGTLLDIGCGPGSLTLLLAPNFARAIGVDADQEMVDQAARQAAAHHVDNVSWRCMRAEDLPADLPSVNVITFAQSFHWMNRPRVAAAARRLLAHGGALVHVSATTHRGVATGEQNPPWDAITDLIETYLGPKQPSRATRPATRTRSIGRPGSTVPATLNYRAASCTGRQTTLSPPCTPCRAPRHTCSETSCPRSTETSARS